MTRPPRRRRYRLALAAVLLGTAAGLFLPALAIDGAAIAAEAAKPTPTSTCAGNSGGHGQGNNCTDPTATCAGNSGGHGQGNNCTGGTGTPGATETPTITATGDDQGNTGGTGSTGGGTGTGSTGGGTGTGNGGVGGSTTGATGGGGGAGGTGTGGNQPDAGTGGAAPDAVAPDAPALAGAMHVAGTGTGSGGGAGAGGGTGGDVVGLPTPGPAGGPTVPGTSLPLWGILWTGTAVITLVTVAALLWLRDKRSAPGTADDDAGTAGADQPAAEDDPSPGPVRLDPIKLEWTPAPDPAPAPGTP